MNCGFIKALIISMIQGMFVSNGAPKCIVLMTMKSVGACNMGIEPIVAYFRTRAHKLATFVGLFEFYNHLLVTIVLGPRTMAS
jgi:hypothetical protein